MILRVFGFILVGLTGCVSFVCEASPTECEKIIGFQKSYIESNPVEPGAIETSYQSKDIALSYLPSRNEYYLDCQNVCLFPTERPDIDRKAYILSNGIDPYESTSNFLLSFSLNPYDYLSNVAESATNHARGLALMYGPRIVLSGMYTYASGAYGMGGLGRTQFRAVLNWDRDQRQVRGRIQRYNEGTFRTLSALTENSPEFFWDKVEDQDIGFCHVKPTNEWRKRINVRY